MFRHRGAILGDFKNEGTEEQHVNLGIARTGIF
jgi:hypothetical protein